MIHIRRAGALDTRAMAELLNAIITQGGTTAKTTKVSAEELTHWMAFAPDKSAWHLAEDDGGQLLGFQWIEPKQGLPDEACDIATFVRLGQTGLGIGTELFNATCKAARNLGYRWINATIRADNTGGLAYYQSRGFEDYARRENVPLKTGYAVDRISKRYDL